VKKIILFLIFLLVPFVGAYDLSFNESMLVNVDDTKHLSSDCQNEWDDFFGKQPGELVGDYCSGISNRIMWLLGFVWIMWMVEPLLRKKLSEIKFSKKMEIYGLTDKSLIIFYRYIGLGLFFMGIYGLWIIR